MFKPPHHDDLPNDAHSICPLDVVGIHISDDGVCAGAFGLNENGPSDSVLLPASGARSIHPAILGLRRPSGDIVFGNECVTTRPGDPKIWGLCRLLGRNYRSSVGALIPAI